MSKTILSMLVATLVCVGVSTAKADHEIGAGKLADMGLSGLTVMSDQDAMAVRGMGYFAKKKKDRFAAAPHSAVFGNSFATINTKKGGAHSENGYVAEGPLAASGDNFSEAGADFSKTETVVIDGVSKSVTTSKSVRVFAGGFSSAMSF